MKFYRKPLFLVALFLALGLASVLFLEIGLEYRLLIADSGGRLLALLPLPDLRFDHVYIHSVNKTLVRERFLARVVSDGAAMALYELRYQTNGVGMPSDAENGFRLEGKEFVLAMDRVFKKIPVFVSPVGGHGVEIGGVFTPFTKWAEPEHLVVISADIQRIIRIRR